MQPSYGLLQGLASATLRSNHRWRLHRHKALASGRRIPWGRAGLSRCYAPFSHGAHFRFWSFSRVETSGGIRTSLAGRYAIALFELARDQRQIESVGKSLDALSQALVDSKDFDELVTSPLVSREEALKSFEAI